MIAPSQTERHEDGRQILQLATEFLQVGQRTPESSGERAAIGWIESQLHKIGLRPTGHAFRYPNDGVQLVPLSLVTPLGILVVGLLAGYLPVFIAVGLVAIFAAWEFIWLPRLFRSGQLDRFIGDRPGVNIIAGITRPWDEIIASPRRLILVTAHYDSAEGQRRHTLDTRALREPFDVLYFLGIAFVFSFFCVSSGLQIIDWIYTSAQLSLGAIRFWNSYGIWLHVLLVGPFAIVMLWSSIAELLQFPRIENPGADDNASGVATLLSVATSLKEELPAEHVDAAVAFWGAEEVGLQGSSAFLRDYGESIPKDAWVVNIDAVGRPDTLMIMLGGGLRTKRSVSDEAKSLSYSTALELGIKKVELIWLSFLSGATDQAVWLYAGYSNTVSISHGETRANPFVSSLYALSGIKTGAAIPNWSHAHTPADSSVSLNPSALACTHSYVMELIRRIARN